MVQLAYLANSILKWQRVTTVKQEKIKHFYCKIFWKEPFLNIFLYLGLFLELFKAAIIAISKIDHIIFF